MTWNIIALRPLRSVAQEVLDAFAEVTVVTEYDSEAAIDTDIDRFDAVVGSVPMPRERVERATNLKVISQSGVGLDAFDIKAATEHGIMVCNNPGANTRAVAEHTIAVMMAIRRDLLRADADVRSGVWEKFGYLAPELEDDVLGVFGCGDIGSLVTTLARGIGMQPIAYDPYRTANDTPDGVEKVEEPIDLFETADVVSVHAPLTDETRGAIGAEELRLLGADGILVNAARGQIVDEGALAVALEADTIFGAGIDVFGEEPVPNDHPLLELDNVLVTPHSAGSTLKSVPAKHWGAAKNVRTVHEGRVPASVVNADAIALRRAYEDNAPDGSESPDSF
jgi:phosphoglycerate dehydrogenase-like enzyme